MKSQNYCIAVVLISFFIFQNTHAFFYRDIGAQQVIAGGQLSEDDQYKFLEKKFKYVFSSFRNILRKEGIEVVCIAGTASIAMVVAKVVQFLIDRKVITSSDVGFTLNCFTKKGCKKMSALGRQFTKNAVVKTLPYSCSAVSSIIAYKLFKRWTEKRQQICKRTLVQFVAEWQEHRYDVPFEFHSLFDGLYEMYLASDSRLLISEKDTSLVVASILQRINNYKK
jgi:hypothetical protein